MRKLTLAALLLGVLALTFGYPVQGIPPLHGLLSLAGLAAYLVLSRYPPITSTQYRQFLVAGALCGLVSFLLAFTGVKDVHWTLLALDRLLAIATVALPLWLVAGPAQFAFVAAAAVGVVVSAPGITMDGTFPGSLHAYAAALACFWVAARSEGLLLPREKKTPRVVVASNIVTLSPEEKARRLAKIEARYQAGEIPEHKYWDLRQELESR